MSLSPLSPVLGSLCFRSSTQIAPKGLHPLLRARRHLRRRSYRLTGRHHPPPAGALLSLLQGGLAGHLASLRSVEARRDPRCGVGELQYPGQGVLCHIASFLERGLGLERTSKGVVLLALPKFEPEREVVIGQFKRNARCRLLASQAWKAG